MSEAWVEQAEEAVNTSEALKQAFLRGETVVASVFAEKMGVTRQGVSDALNRFHKRGWLVREKVSQKRGGAIVGWTCKEMEKMAGYKPLVQRFNPMKKKQEAFTPNIPALYQVWGIGLADIALPTIKHGIKGEWA